MFVMSSDNDLNVRLYNLEKEVKMLRAIINGMRESGVCSE